jgi:heptaprenyl diphosphate synthase
MSGVPESADRAAGPRISDTIRSSAGDKRVFFIGYLATMAIFLSIAEAVVPKPLPWMKIGFSNAITLYAFGVLRPREVLTLVLARVIATSLFLGTFLSLGFLLGLVSSLSSLAVMLFFYTVGRRWLSLVGISILGATASNAAQLAVVNALFVNSRLSFYFLPFLFLFALLGGGLSGLLGRFMKDNL